MFSQEGNPKLLYLSLGGIFSISHDKTQVLADKEEGESSPKLTKAEILMECSVCKKPAVVWKRCCCLNNYENHLQLSAIFQMFIDMGQRWLKYTVLHWLNKVLLMTCQVQSKTIYMKHISNTYSFCHKITNSLLLL